MTSKTRRPLSDAEISALPGRMADMINLSKVRLINGRHPVAWLARYLLGHRHVIVVRGSNIYWPRLPDDLSAKPELLGLLAHELTHVWQYQKGMNIFKYMFRERGRYKYKLLPDQPFSHYGYEQQAAMVEDWVRLHTPRCMARYNHGCSVWDLAALVPFADATEPPAVIKLEVIDEETAPAAKAAKSKAKTASKKTAAKSKPRVKKSSSPPEAPNA